MTAKFYAILTHQGAARLANAAALGTKLNLTQMAVGDANGLLPTPDPAQTQLINQQRIAPLNMLSIDDANPSQIIAEQIIPENEGGWWIREIGLYDDAGVLIAVANCPETYKPLLQEGAGRTQTIRMLLVVSSTSDITLKIDPAVVLATRQYVDGKIIEVKTYTDEQLKGHAESRNHPDGTLLAKGFVQLSSATDSSSETLAATPKAVKEVYDLAKKSSIDTLYPVGIVTWFAQNKDPNTLFPNTTWEYIGENKTIRLGKADGSDIMESGGRDNVTLELAQLPAHEHAFSVSTTDFDHGTKTTNSGGAHTHNYSEWHKGGQASRFGLDDVWFGSKSSATGSAGDHSHTVNIGSHSHTVAGKTKKEGYGTGFSIVNTFIKLMGWYRTA